MNFGVGQKKIILDITHLVVIQGTRRMVEGATSIHIDVMGRESTSRWVLLRAWHWQPVSCMSLSSKFLSLLSLSSILCLKHQCAVLLTPLPPASAVLVLPVTNAVPSFQENKSLKLQECDSFHVEKSIALEWNYL